MKWDILFIVLIVFVIVALIAFARKRCPEEKGYDERQLSLRAAGYRLGFFVTLIAGFLALMFVETEVIPLASATLALFVAIMAGIVAFAVFCILKDVFFRIGEKGTFYIVLYGIIVVVDGAVAISRVVDGSILKDGVLTFDGSSSLVMTLAFLVILAALLVRRFARERDE